ncbi:hypothetical protein [Hydrogenophaga sp. 5NK40-0174]|uniref:hypothetical protein n=1 Tax=Hydrogenophaga sp. 5NK40-0174 TaxID=3127649 RepID=UPI00310571DF
MNNSTRSRVQRVAAWYAAWAVVNVGVAWFHIGDGGAGVHLALMFSGFPAATGSLLLDHGSMVAVVSAALLGLVQWCLVALLWVWAYPER